MSAAPHKCESCNVEGVLDRAGKFPEEGEDATYGVGWRCPQCNKLSVDLCPVGPVEPNMDSCLNCGTPIVGGTTCSGCGMSSDEAGRFLGIHDQSSPCVEDAQRAFEKGLYRHGFAVLDVLLQKNPTNAKAWEEKGTTYQVLRLNQAAVRCYRRAISLDPKPLVQIALACALSDIKDHEAAIAVYDGVLSTSEDNEILAIAHANRGNSHEAIGHVEFAISDFEEALKREAARVTHYQNYSRLFVRRKRWSDSVDVVTRGLNVVTGAARIPLLLEKARSHNEQGQAEAGLAPADEALKLSPDEPRALYQRAWSLGMLGRLDEAVSSLGRLLELEPENQDAAMALGRIEAALVAGRRSKPWWKFWS